MNLKLSSFVLFGVIILGARQASGLPFALVNFSVGHAKRPSSKSQQQSGSIRGVVFDGDFEIPLAKVEISLIEIGAKSSTGVQGDYVLNDVEPGTYTVVFSKPGYNRGIRGEVVVLPGQLTDLNIELVADFKDLEEFIVQDALQLNAGSELALLDMRFESPALVDSISAELMSRAGASDAASALKLVSGASVADGKSAVIRGLPDRYVSSQLNGVRLPTADEDKRAVELDQFPSTVIESLQVSKTFTPDQQGDASGGAVDVRLKGIPDENTLQFKSQLGYNSEAAGRSDFLTYDGGGLNFWGNDKDSRDIQFGNLGDNWDGAVGVSEADAPIDSKWSLAGGGKQVLDNGVTIGGFGSFFYERDSNFFDDGIDDSYWVVNPGEGLVPETNQGVPPDDFLTSLFDVDQSVQSVQWGGLASFGVESANHRVNLSYLYSRTAEDRATLAEDTRGKQFFFGPDYNPNDETAPGNESGTVDAAPYLRLETLEYTERTTGSLQLTGDHTIETDGLEIGSFEFLNPQLNWTLARSFADLYQPDKRQFGAKWFPNSFNPGAPPFIPAFVAPNFFAPLNPAANVNLGNFQRIWKDIAEDSESYTLDLEFPFEQWDGEEGALQFGVFEDKVDRAFDQDTFSNFGDFSTFEADFSESWSQAFVNEDHPISEALTDVDYDASQDISAWYGMLDLPITSKLTLIGGARFEGTEIGIVNEAEEFATWFPEGAISPQDLDGNEADVDFSEDNVLPAISLTYEPFEKLTLRAAYSETIARQTFKELTPILQQEFLGGPVFIGNPGLGLSDVQNQDLRVDYRPYEGGLLSASWFQKDIEDAIEYVQRFAGFTYTTPVNYPEGRLQGLELEVRQDFGHFIDAFEGFSMGANATFIDSNVRLPADESATFSTPQIQAPLKSRDMTNAPEHLYNLFMTYDVPKTQTQLALFYTITGDTLVAGASTATGRFIPNVYAKEFDTLNFSLSQPLGQHFNLQFQAKNLTNPEIDEVYRSRFIGGDVTKTSFTRGLEFSLSLSARFSF